jgi:hypothetical protein
MKNKPYKVSGDPDNGFRIAIQQGHGVKAGDKYNFSYIGETASGMIIPAGSLVYVPVVGEKK